ncbi:facilitated trehalose transporter Tret1-like [Onthophagus taurus]|uniref:facilitated trehalose transporter Tret1-like n=1 Tax=Onthophagus taurus TaxID=166361 RepID=UPI000C20C0EB|nr:facilitated trehalose transporter Tret1-like [Onthophagus taurus]
MFIKKSKYVQYLAALTASLTIGSNTAYVTWSSPILPQLTSKNSPIGVQITNAEASWVVSIILLGGIVTCPFSASFVKKFGPRRSLLFSSIFIMLPWIPITLANSVWILYISRFIAGMATGTITAGVTIYNSEIADQEIRGKLGTAFTIMKLMGHFVVLTFGPFVSYQVLCVICGVMPLICFCTIYFMPESPYYLLKIGEKHRAKESLAILGSDELNENDLERKMNEIEKVVNEDMRNKSGMVELFRNPRYRKGLLTMTGVKVLHSMSGTVAIESYMQSIIGSSSSSISPEISSIIFGAIQFPAAFLASAIVDKLGRKPLLIISAFGCALALISEGIYFYIQDVLKSDLKNISWIPTTGIIVFLISTPLGVSSLPYVLMGELFPVNIKESAITLIIFYGVSMSFVVSKFYQPVLEMWGLYTVFWIFGGVCLAGMVFVWCVVPETKGKSFGDIQIKLNRSKNKNNLDKIENLEG